MPCYPAHSFIFIFIFEMFRHESCVDIISTFPLPLFNFTLRYFLNIAQFKLPIFQRLWYWLKCPARLRHFQSVP